MALPEVRRGRGDRKRSGHVETSWVGGGVLEQAARCSRVDERVRRCSGVCSAAGSDAALHAAGPRRHVGPLRLVHAGAHTGARAPRAQAPPRRLRLTAPLCCCAAGARQAGRPEPHAGQRGAAGALAASASRRARACGCAACVLTPRAPRRRCAGHAGHRRGLCRERRRVRVRAGDPHPHPHPSPSRSP